MIPVILSGGSGTRLWPLSQPEIPKQFASLFEPSLQVKTLRRVSNLGSPWTLTVRNLANLSRQACKQSGVPQNQIILEPLGRNTAPAIGLLCRLFAMRGWEDEVVGVFPADHLIEDEELFAQAVRLGAQWAEKGSVVTLGISPWFPATGYGYIQTAIHAKNTSGTLNVRDVIRFCEKPKQEVAERFLSEGNYFWNAGMFLFKVKVMADHFGRLMPNVWALLLQLKSDGSNIDEIYEQLPSISVDYGIMEHLQDQVCIPCNMGWSDVGSWDEMARLSGQSDRQAGGHGLAKAAYEVGSSDNWVFSQLDKDYGLVEVSDLLVVDSDEGLLITRRGNSEKVKDISDQIVKAKRLRGASPRAEVRPWGSYQTLASSGKFKVKRIRVEPGEQLSYQSHHRRSEHWIVVQGKGEVILNGEAIQVSEGSHLHIPQNAKHRIKNIGKSSLLEFVEVQLGSYFGEDDITRYSDEYGRA